MAETLLAILVVTSSAKGSNLVYRWPPHPSTHPRLARPRPYHDSTCIHADNPWRAAYNRDSTRPCADYEPEDDDYLWRRPHIIRDRSMSFSHPHSHPSSRRTSPSKDPKDLYAVDATQDAPAHDDYDDLLGYSAEFLASLLSPQRAMCHQKFELVVDDLAFIGHPVCAEQDGVWRFAPEKPKTASRGRGTKKGQSPRVEEASLTPERGSTEKPSASTWLQMFHLVLVLDLPDPTSSASGGNISKYFDTLYEQIVFAMTAVMYQEQILHNFVETECEMLGGLKDDYNSRGESFEDYVNQALTVSSLAPAVKTVYESIKDGTIARITLRGFSMELQLPPYLDSLLHDDDSSDVEFGDKDGEDEFAYGSAATWGPEMSFAWRLPALTPWKSLLRLDGGEFGFDPWMTLRGPQMSTEDRELAEQLIKFLESASVTLCLADMASLLDWDLETQVFPIVRWLVHHRRAKVVDVIHPTLKTVFTLPQKLPAPLAELSAEFARTFSHPAIPPLAKILSQISTSRGPHFYGAVVGSKDMIPMYQDVVMWMLERDLLVTLHLRVRVFATSELKERVRVKRELALARRGRIRSRSQSISASRKHEIGKDESSKPVEITTEASPQDYWFNMSPKSARRQTRKMSPPQASRRERSMSDAHVTKAPEKEKEADIDYDDEDILFDETIDISSSSGIDETTSQKWDDALASMIPDPARATPLERQWLASMSEGKDPYIARRFELINQYFDGKCSDDEILYKAEISRKQLREVLHHYEEYLQLFLHPS